MKLKITAVAMLLTILSGRDYHKRENASCDSQLNN